MFSRDMLLIVGTGEIVAMSFTNGVFKVRYVADGKNVETDQLLKLTLHILASVSIFSIPFSIHLL